MPASYMDLYVDQGSDYSTNLLMNNPDGTVINVTNYVFNGNVKESYFSNNVFASLTIQAVDAPNGNISITLSRTITTNMNAGVYVYDITVLNTLNVQSRLLEGKLTINPGVTGITPSGFPAL